MGHHYNKYITDRQYIKELTPDEIEILLFDFKIDHSDLNHFINSNYRYLAVYVKDLKDFEKIKKLSSSGTCASEASTPEIYFEGINAH